MKTIACILLFPIVILISLLIDDLYKQEFWVNITTIIVSVDALLWGIIFTHYAQQIKDSDDDENSGITFGVFLYNFFICGAAISCLILGFYKTRDMVWPIFIAGIFWLFIGSIIANWYQKKITSKKYYDGYPEVRY